MLTLTSSKRAKKVRIFGFFGVLYAVVQHLVLVLRRLVVSFALSNLYVAIYDPIDQPVFIVNASAPKT